MWLTSSDFADRGKIPRICTCEGDDLSPALAWGEAPPQTRSYALVCNDPDAPGGVFRHWAAYDIPAAVAGLARGEGRATQEKFNQAVNDFGRPGYGGPCPPRGHGAHHYRFQLLALSIDRLPVGKGARCREVEREAQKHMLAEAELVGTFERWPRGGGACGRNQRVAQARKKRSDGPSGLRARVIPTVIAIDRCGPILACQLR